MSLFSRNRYPAHLEDELPFGKQVLIFFWEVFKVLVISLVIIVPIRHFLIKPFYVKGASMEPNFYDHEYLIINQLGYRLGEPSRGDAVVFRYPFDTRQYFIKRVIGLPGETVKISGGNVTIINAGYPNGVVLQESYLSPSIDTLGEVQVTLTADEYYVLGDNRQSSLDSRAFGPVKRDLIIGETFLRGWPINKAGLVTNQTNYNL